MDALFTPTLIIQKEPWELELFDELKEGWDVRRKRIKPGRVDVGVSLFNTQRLQFSSVSYSNAIMIEGSPPKNTVMISIIQSNDGYLFCNQMRKGYEIIISRYGDDVDYIAKDYNTIITFAIEEHYFCEMFFYYFEQTLEEFLAGHRAVIKESLLSRFLSQMESWIVFFQQDKRVFSPEAYKNMEDEMLEALFSIIVVQKKQNKEIKQSLIKARELLQDNIKNIYSISDLTKEINISSRTLQYQFKTTFGFTPKEYFNYMRLNAIREELKLRCCEEGLKISDIALKYSFFNLSHFSYQYKKMFDETPSQTLRRFYAKNI